MKVPYLNQWLNDPEINAICWTLFHSLWIGLIVAILAGIVIVCTGKSRANLRYRLFCGLLVLFIVTISLFGMYKLIGTDAVPVNILPNSLPDQFLDESQMADFPHSFMDNSLALLNQNAGRLFGLWLIFFLFKSVRLVIGLLYVQRIRSYKVEPVGGDWALKVQEFGERMGIKKRIAVIQSTLIRVPVALGYLKPLIAVPAGLLLQLPADQVETIIWHELAHIYRRDYLINILQKMIEAIFFFNPAVLWLSALVREERENCCDDIVLANVQQKTNYMAALVAFYSQKNNAAGLAIGLSLRPNQLIHRLRRMVHQENKRLNVVELVVLIAGILALSAFTFIPQVKPGIKSSVAYIKKTFSETLAIAAPEQGHPPKPAARLYRSPDPILTDKKDDIGIDTLIKFKSIRFKNSNEDKANRELNAIDGQGNRYHIIVTDGRLALAEFNEQTAAATEFSKFENLLAQIDQIMQQKFANPSPYYAKEDQNMAKKLASGWQKPASPTNNFSKDSTSEPQEPKKKIPLVDASADRARILGIIASLLEHKVVPGASSIDWFALTEEQLVVNGQKQDSRLHQLLKLKYGIKPDNGLFFGPSKVHGTGIFFDKGDL